MTALNNEYGNVYRSFIEVILGWGGPIYYNDLIDNVQTRFPDMPRQYIQSSLSRLVTYGYVQKQRFEGLKHYSVGQHCPAAYLNPTEDSDYANGKDTPIFNIDESVQSLFDVLKYPATSKQAFDVFVRLYPSMEGYKHAFDGSLTRLSLSRKIGKTKDSMGDHNASNKSKYHYASNALLIKIKNQQC